MKLKIASILAMSVISMFASAAQGANSHLGVIPFENMIDVSFLRAPGSVVTRTLREGGIVSATYSNANNCFLLARAFVITDAQLNVTLQDPASTSLDAPAVYTVHGANTPLTLATGNPDVTQVGEAAQFQQNFTGGIAMPAGSHICMSGNSNAKYNWYEARISGYYPSK